MTWHITHDVDAFLAEAGEFLKAEPAANTLPLTVSEAVRAGGGTNVFGADEPLFGWWREDTPEDGPGQVSGAFLQTPPYAFLLSRIPAHAIAPLARALHDRDATVPGVNAEAATAEALAAAWTGLTGQSFVPHQNLRLYRLAELVPPDPAPAGAARAADKEDRELLVDWFRACVEEMDHVQGPSVDKLVDDRLTRGGVSLWESEDGPGAMACRSPVIADMARIGPVYTPPGLRRRGYASGATAEATRAALAAGAREVVLFTDLANPTSNAIYQRIGYRPVHDCLWLAAAPADTTTA